MRTSKYQQTLILIPFIMCFFIQSTFKYIILNL